MADQSNFVEGFLKKNKSAILPITCIKIDEKYSHHRKLVIGKKYYTKNFIEGSGCKVYSEETCGDGSLVGLYWTWMFLCIPLHRERQIDSVFND